MIREDWMNYFNILSLALMFTNQLILIHLTKRLYRVKKNSFIPVIFIKNPTDYGSEG